MRVELIQATPNAGQMVADIASICYGKEQARNPEIAFMFRVIL